MQVQQCNNTQQLDEYSIFVASKYLMEMGDYINLICVCHKFEKITEKLNHNPISVKSKKLFPMMKTQYLYSQDDIMIDFIDNYEILYEVDYYQYLGMKNKNTKFHHVTYANVDGYGYKIPENVNKLGEMCYGGYMNACSVKTITIPNNLTSIGDRCFFNCDRLKTIDIQSPTLSIGEKCFDNCTSLRSIKLPSSISVLKAGTFHACSSLTNVELPLKLVSIGDECFEKCTNYKIIKLPKSLIQIGKKCFSYCGIESIEIPDNVKIIGVDCFLGCTSLTHLKLPTTDNNEFTSIVSYNDSILYKKFGIHCPNMALTVQDVSTLEDEQKNPDTLVIPNGIVELLPISLQHASFRTIQIPTTVTAIDEACFYCAPIKSLCIPSSVQSIGIRCFVGCTDLKQLSVPLNQNNKYPFKACYRDYLVLKNCGIDVEQTLVFNASDYYKYKYVPIKFDFVLELIESVIDVPDDEDIAFARHLSKQFGFFKNEPFPECLTGYDIPKNIVSMKKSHLSKNITNIKIPTTVTSLSDECFKGYDCLQTINIPTTIKRIGKHLIDGCVRLQELKYSGDWNDIVVSYDDHITFKKRKIIFNNIEYTNDDIVKYGNVIPSIVHSLHHSCYDRSQQTFYIQPSITSLDNNMFASIDYVFTLEYSFLQNISIPTTITTIPKKCFSKCKLLTSVSLPSTLTTIKKKAFEECISLETINIPSSVTIIEPLAFYRCCSLSKIILPDTLPIFGNGCFKGCSSLNGLDLPSFSF